MDERTYSILKYLENHNRTSIHEISKTLELKEHNVRYDLDKIDEILKGMKYDPIHRGTKGNLVISSKIDFYKIFEKEELFLMQSQRVKLIEFLVLFNIESLNLTKLASTFEVSRSSIKKDLKIVTKELMEYGFELEYQHSYELHANPYKAHEVMVNEFKQYIYLFSRGKTEFSPYEQQIMMFIEAAFSQIPVKDVIIWIKCFLEKLNVVLSDESFRWYISSIMVSLWYSERGQLHPLNHLLEDTIDSKEYQTYFIELEKVIGRNTINLNRSMIIRLLQYTNRYDQHKSTLPLLEAEQTVQILIEKMSKKFNLNFQSDERLYEGLINHVEPLIVRILDNVEMDEDVMSLFDDDSFNVYIVMREVAKSIPILSKIKNQNEIGYLTIHFVASMKRILNTHNTRVLLVCGLGYGTTTLVKETLLSEFHVEIIDTIPSYKLQSYTNWKMVDYVITTMDVLQNVPCSVVQIKPILTDEDYRRLENLPLQRKRTQSIYYSIHHRLSFLEADAKSRVLKVVQEELGFSDSRLQENVTKLSDLIEVDTITKISNRNWREVIHLCTDLLVRKEIIDVRYTNDIFNSIDQYGFYSVIDGQFAILHGSYNKGVFKSGLSLVVSQEPIQFENKEVNVVFCLASVDKKEHIPAVVNLMNIVKKTDFLEEVTHFTNAIDIYNYIKVCEQKVKELR